MVRGQDEDRSDALNGSDRRGLRIDDSLVRMLPMTVVVPDRLKTGHTN